VKAKKETVDHPSHYTWMNGIEVVDICEQVATVSGWNIASAVKYLLRADHKHADGGIEDIQKAIWYLQREERKRAGVSKD
jgi:hypothetical protein